MCGSWWREEEEEEKDFHLLWWRRSERSGCAHPVSASKGPRHLKVHKGEVFHPGA